MEITKVKWWKKTVKGETTDHVRIGYNENDKELSLHQFGENAKAAPAFYEAFKAFSPLVATAIGLPAKMASGLIVDSVSISYSEDKEGNENTTYTMSVKVKAGHAGAVLNVSMNHKYIPEGFEDALSDLVGEGEDYVNGIREQTELPLEEKTDDSE